MARTLSTMPELGMHAPDFALPDTVTGRTVRLSDFAGAPALLVMFICNHCPFVKHVRDQLAAIGREYHPRGVAIVAISSNDVQAHPDDGPEKMRLEAADAGYTFPYLYDETQQVANAYKAACTPDFFLFDRSRRLFYRGQLDASRPARYLDNKTVHSDGRDLRAALEALLAGEPAPQPQLPSLGCNIKWKPGNEPTVSV
ncbi:MAG TPA: thioredoxin family protein [Phycisphaerales bacterium]|nr:thioredoxin family protein [Phycisphaerales bacterium]